jgi:hypothetical protein
MVALQPVDKLLDVRNQTVAVVDNTVHIADKAAFVSNGFKIDHRRPSFGHHLIFGRLLPCRYRFPSVYHIQTGIARIFSFFGHHFFVSAREEA